MKSKLFAFNISKEVLSQDVFRIDGAYDPQEQIWVAEDGSVACCTYGWSFKMTCDEPLCQSPSPDYFCDQTDTVCPGFYCPHCY